MNYFKITDSGKKKTSEIIAEIRAKFDVWVYDGENVDKEFPAPKKKTTRYFKKSVEADEELKNLSADDLKEKGIEGITFRERLLMELDYFNETGEHLDIDNVTLCSGSRNSAGDVPCVFWNSDLHRVRVSWCSPGYRHGALRARAAALAPSDLFSSAFQILKEIKDKRKYVI